MCEGATFCWERQISSQNLLHRFIHRGHSCAKLMPGTVHTFSQQPWVLSDLIIPFYRQGNQGRERLNDSQR